MRCLVNGFSTATLKPVVVVPLRNCRSRLLLAVAVGLFTARPAATQAAGQEVVFRVNANAAVDWFEINNPSIHGKLNVTNAPYPSDTNLNGSAVDVNGNRLIYNTEGAFAVPALLD